jgi:outer membrane murein-binding lipoprotein Lpp
MWIKTGLILLTAILLNTVTGVIASEDSTKIQALTSQVSVLRAEIDELKAAVELLNAIKPDVTTLMPDIAERMHVMHYAGEAEDWAVASHELSGIKRLLGVMQRVDPEKGAMASGFMHEPFEKIDAAIDHQDQAAFSKSLAGMVTNCNSCHVAAGNPAMKITLNAKDALSLRHSHDLGKSKGMGGGHMHN